MKVFVTGGAGFIGSHLVDRLIDRGDSVVVLDNFATGRRENLLHHQASGKLEIVEGNVLDSGLVGKLSADAEQIYHLAAAVGVKRILDHPLQSIETNLKGTENVLNATPPGVRVMIASTSEVYGKNASDSLTEEDDSIIGPTSVRRWLYAASKAMDEFLSLAHFRERGVQAVLVRFFNTVGPRQTGMYGMVLPRFVQMAIDNQPIPIYGDGRQRRNFTYVGDAVEGIMRLMDAPDTPGVVFNMGGREEVTIEELAIRVRRMVGSTSPLQYIPYSYAFKDGFEDMKRRVPDTTRLQQYTGFFPQTGVDEIIRHVVEHFQQKPVLTPA